MNKDMDEKPEAVGCMTELEELLRGEHGGQAKLDVACDLARAAAECRSLLQDGLSPAGYERAQSVYDGLAAAYEIISWFPVPTGTTINDEGNA